MWQDEVLEEIYNIREKHAKSFNYDFKEMCKDLRQKQIKTERKIITKPLNNQSQKIDK